MFSVPWFWSVYGYVLATLFLCLLVHLVASLLHWINCTFWSIFVALCGMTISACLMFFKLSSFISSDVSYFHPLWLLSLFLSLPPPWNSSFPSCLITAPPTPSHDMISTITCLFFPFYYFVLNHAHSCPPSISAWPSMVTQLTAQLTSMPLWLPWRLMTHVHRMMYSGQSFNLVSSLKGSVIPMSLCPSIHFIYSISRRCSSKASLSSNQLSQPLLQD